MRDFLLFSFAPNKQGLEVPTPTTTSIRLRPHSQSSSERTNSYRFSMANLEETHEAELDAILGELSLLEQHAKSTTPTTIAAAATAKNLNMNGVAADHHGGGGGVKTINNHLQNGSTAATTTAIMMSPLSCAGAIGERNGRTHSRSNSTISGVTNSSISISSESGNGSGSDSSGGSNSGSSNGIGNGSGVIGGGSMRDSRTDSPDNDSAFSDTVSLLSSESSASSNISNLMGNSHGKNILSMNMNLLQVCTHQLLRCIYVFVKVLRR